MVRILLALVFTALFVGPAQGSETQGGEPSLECSLDVLDLIAPGLYEANNLERLILSVAI